MEKLLFKFGVATLVAATLAFGGCGDKKDTPAPTNVNSAKPAVSSSQAPKATSSNSSNEKMVGVKAGIGDSVTRWEKDYGTLQGQGMVRYIDDLKGSKINLVCVNNVVMNITVSKTNNGNRNDNLINKMLPEDINEVNREHDDSDKMVVKDKIYYHSDTLEKADAATKGNITVIEQTNGNTSAYIATVIDCTPRD